MSMRMLSQDEFDDQLRAAGLQPIEGHTSGHRAWMTKDGRVILAPCHGGPYPDSVRDALLERVNLLYRKPNHQN